MTSRGAGLAGAAVALWIAARAFGIDELQMVAVAGMCLVVLAVVWVWIRPIRLEVSRLVTPVSLAFDEVADVEVTLTNVGRTRTPHLVACEQLPAALRPADRFLVPVLRRSRRATFTYPVWGARRGRLSLGPTRVVVTDPFGLAQRARSLGTSTTITVYPHMVTLADGLPLGAASKVRRDGKRRSVANGDELADIREYVRGDDLRAVHWPSTAHRGRLMVRRNEGTNAPVAVVLLDRRLGRHGPSSEAAPPHTDSFELAVSAAASVGRHLAARGRSVTLLDAPVTKRLPQRTVASLLAHLATVQRDEVDFRGLLHQVSEGVAGDGTIIAVITTPDADDLRALVRAGRGFRSRAALLLPTEPAQVQRAAAELAAAGWHTTVVDGPLAPAWEQLFIRSTAVPT